MIGIVTVTCSSVRAGALDAAVEQINPSLLLQTENVLDSWIEIDFGVGRTVIPNR